MIFEKIKIVICRTRGTLVQPIQIPKSITIEMRTMGLITVMILIRRKRVSRPRFMQTWRKNWTKTGTNWPRAISNPKRLLNPNLNHKMILTF